MAIRKYIVKMNHVEALVKVVNTSESELSTTIGLTSDLLKGNEFLTPGKTPKVAIGTLEWSVKDSSGKIRIVRNGVEIHHLHASRNITNSFGADHEQSGSNIVVNMTAGTLYIRLLKVDGYTPEFRPEQFGGEDPH